MNSYTKLLFFSVLMVSFVACGENTTSVSDNNGMTSNDSGEVFTSDSSSKTELLNFQDVYFYNMNVSYDGNNHILDEVVGIPDGTKITYTNRINYKDVGSYQATALLEKENYNSKLLSATLNIIPISFSNLKFEDKSIKYDGLDHINDIRLEGFLPEGTTTDLEIKDENDNKVSEAINVGKYYYTITINNKNYNSLSLSATLTIKKEVKDMPVYVSNNEVYFSNGLDNEYIYSITDEDGIKKIDSSIPQEFKDCDSSVVYVAKSLFLNSAKEFKNGDTSILYSDGNIDDFVKYSDEIYFYSCNSLLDNEKRGIYKVDVSNDEDEPIVTKIYSGKTDSLSINKSSLFFINKEDNYLYKIDINTNEKTLITETKINEYVVSDTKLYCCVNGILNDYIGVINIDSNSYEISKLTDYSGEFLKIRNNYLYFNNIDLYSLINLEYKGICRINLSTKVINKVLYTEDVNGFDVDKSGNIYYNNTSDLHLYKYDVSNNTYIDLLKDFVVPEVTPYNLGGKTLSYNNKIYYLNMYADKTLFVYDTISKTNRQCTSNKVMDFYINGDELYFNQVTLFVNNDLYKIDLKSGGEAVKISSNDVRNMCIYDNYLYACHYNFAGVAGGLSRMNLDGSEYVKFSEVNGAKNLTIKDDKLYFINCSTGEDNGNIEYIDISEINNDSLELSSTVLSKNIKNVKQFIFDNDNIFYLYNGVFDNSVKKTNFNSLDESISIASKNTNPSEMILKDETIYYYSYAISALNYAGFYKVNKNVNEDSTQELILGYDNKYYGTSFAILNDNLYFLNYIPKLLMGNSHIYKLNLKDVSIEQID